MHTRRLLISFALAGLCSQAYAAGETITTIATVQDSVLGGYVATMPAGWKQSFVYGVATPSSAAASSQQFFAYNQPKQIEGVTSTTLPPTIYLTRINSAGTVLSRDPLPAAAQISQTNCVLPVYSSTTTYNGCPQVTVFAFPSKSLTGRMIVNALQLVFTRPSTYSYKSLVYAFDPNATLAADKWMLLSTQITDSSVLMRVQPSDSLGSFTPADTLVYAFNRASASSTSISSVVTK